MSAANAESNTQASSRDAACASASTSASSATSFPAAAASSSSAALCLEHELAAVKQRILDVEGDIAKVEQQLTAAMEKRDRFEDDEKKWERHDGDVQRLAKEKEQLRTEKEQLREELKRKELAQDRAGEYMRVVNVDSLISGKDAALCSSLPSAPLSSLIQMPLVCSPNNCYNCKLRTASDNSMRSIADSILCGEVRRNEHVHLVRFPAVRQKRNSSALCAVRVQVFLLSGIMCAAHRAPRRTSCTLRLNWWRVASLALRILSMRLVLARPVQSLRHGWCRLLWVLTFGTHSRIRVHPPRISTPGALRATSTPACAAL